MLPGFLTAYRAPGITSMDIVNWFTSDVYNALGMVGVPLFVMLTGVLLLNPAKAEEPLGVFYKKKARPHCTAVCLLDSGLFHMEFCCYG